MSETHPKPEPGQPKPPGSHEEQAQPGARGEQEQGEGRGHEAGAPVPEGRPVERKTEGRRAARGTAAMDPQTRQEVARKGGLAVSRNRQHMAEIGRKGGQTVSKNREHMASIGRKGGEASRGHR
jgi:hypothetical protein